MNAHHFLKDIKVKRFCLTLAGEARLWFQSLEPINVDWQGLQNLFRQQYCKIGNTREQLFHTWRSFHSEENTETIRCMCDGHKTSSCIFRLRRTSNFRGIQKHAPYKIVLVIISHRESKTSRTVETAKRILTKEKIDRQIARQSSSTAFMNVRDSYNKRVDFNT